MTSIATAMTKSGALAAAALLSAPLLAQEPVFRSAVDIVVLNVAVTNRDGKQVRDLDQQDFSVFENGRKQEVQYFRRSDVPLSVMMLLDVSDSMTASLPLAQKAAIGFVRGMRPQDLASVVPFGSRMENPLPFTSDQPTLEEYITRTKANGNTALFDTIYIAVRQLREAAGVEMSAPRRQAVLLLTDGYDSTSLTSFDEALEAARRSEAAMYIIQLPGSKAAPERMESPDLVLSRLAQRTGGRVYRSEAPQELPGIYRKIKAELEAQYLLAYRSDDRRRDGGFRQVAVRMEKPGLSARTRPGYFALPSSASAGLNHSDEK